MWNNFTDAYSELNFIYGGCDRPFHGLKLPLTWSSCDSAKAENRNCFRRPKCFSLSFVLLPLYIIRGIVRARCFTDFDFQHTECVNSLEQRWWRFYLLFRNFQLQNPPPPVNQRCITYVVYSRDDLCDLITVYFFSKIFLRHLNYHDRVTLYMYMLLECCMYKWICVS